MPGYVLLEFEVLVGCEENREAEGLRALEECAVLQSLEANLRDGSKIWQVELVCQFDRQRLVNENAHSLPGAHPRDQAPRQPAPESQWGMSGESRRDCRQPQGSR